MIASRKRGRASKLRNTPLVMPRSLASFHSKRAVFQGRTEAFYPSARSTITLEEDAAQRLRANAKQTQTEIRGERDTENERAPHLPHQPRANEQAATSAHIVSLGIRSHDFAFGGKGSVRNHGGGADGTATDSLAPASQQRIAHTLGDKLKFLAANFEFFRAWPEPAQDKKTTQPLGNFLGAPIWRLQPGNLVKPPLWLRSGSYQSGDLATFPRGTHGAN